MRDNPTELFFTDRTKSLLSIDVSIDYDELFNYDKWTEDDIHSLLLAKFYLKNHFGIYISYLLILYFESRQSNDAPEHLLRYWASERNWWRVVEFKHYTRIASVSHVRQMHKKHIDEPHIHYEMEKVILANVSSILSTIRAFSNSGDDKRLNSLTKLKFDIHRLYNNGKTLEEISLLLNISYTSVQLTIKKIANLANFVKFYESQDKQDTNNINNNILLTENIEPLVNYKCINKPIDDFFDFNNWSYADLLCLLKLYTYEKQSNVIVSILCNYISFLSNELSIPPVQIIFELAVYYEWCQIDGVNRKLNTTFVLNKSLNKGIFNKCSTEDLRIIKKSRNIIIYLMHRKSLIKDIEWTKNIIERRSKLRSLVLEQGMPLVDFIELYKISDKSTLCYDLIVIKKLTDISQCLIQTNNIKTAQNKSKRS